MQTWPNINNTGHVEFLGKFYGSSQTAGHSSLPANRIFQHTHKQKMLTPSCLSNSIHTYPNHSFMKTNSITANRWKNTFKHKKWNLDFSQHNQPFQGIQLAKCSAYKELQVTWHSLEKEEIRNFTWFWRKVRCSCFLAKTSSNRWWFVLPRVNNEEGLAQHLL